MTGFVRLRSVSYNQKTTRLDYFWSMVVVCPAAISRYPAAISSALLQSHAAISYELQAIRGRYDDQPRAAFAAITSIAAIFYLSDSYSVPALVLSHPSFAVMLSALVVNARQVITACLQQEDNPPHGAYKNIVDVFEMCYSRLAFVNILLLPGESFIFKTANARVCWIPDDSFCLGSLSASQVLPQVIGTNSNTVSIALRVALLMWVLSEGMLHEPKRSGEITKYLFMTACSIYMFFLWGLIAHLSSEKQGFSIESYAVFAWEANVSASFGLLSSMSPFIPGPKFECPAPQITCQHEAMQLVPESIMAPIFILPLFVLFYCRLGIILDRYPDAVDRSNMHARITNMIARIIACICTLPSIVPRESLKQGNTAIYSLWHACSHAPDKDEQGGSLIASLNNA